MLRFRVVLAGSLVLASLVNPGEARSVELGAIGGEPATVDVTNTATATYRFEDSYGEVVDRLNVRANWWRLNLGLRFDTWLYYETLTRAEARERADRELGPEASPVERNEATNAALRDVHSRYLRTLYPSKLWIGYNQPGLDITVGDFYAQLGRGLVLSIRNIDELAVDTTARGAKVVVDHDFGPVRAAATLLGGVMNPSRVDEVSGRRLHGEPSPLFFGFPEAGDLETYVYDASGAPVLDVTPARPSYLDDRLLGGRIEVGADLVQIAANAALLFRTSYAAELLDCEDACGEDQACRRRCAADFPVFSTTNAARSRDTIRTFGGSLNIPSIAKHGDLYVEVVGQQLRDGQIGRGAGGRAEKEDLSGLAVYLSANARGGPVTAGFEGKHYRTFLPLSANVDVSTPGFLAPEFDIVAYNQPPTAEPIYVEAIGSPNICVTGGKGRIDYRFAPNLNVYTWLGHYVSATEVDQQNLRCADRNDRGEDLRTRTWDTAIGTDLDFEERKSHLRAWVGARVTDRFERVEGSSPAFYREGYVRYDVVKHVAGPFSLQAQGFHRRRFEPIAFTLPWTEGENYTALQWSPHFSFIFGYEYLARAGCRVSDPDVDLCHYFSGGVQWRSASSDGVLDKLLDSVNVFVGQRRGAIRCVSGVCRYFPPFEGARLELVSRF